MNTSPNDPKDQLNNDPTKEGLFAESRMYWKQKGRQLMLFLARAYLVVAVPVLVVLFWPELVHTGRWIDRMLQPTPLAAGPKDPVDNPPTTLTPMPTATVAVHNPIGYPYHRDDCNLTNYVTSGVVSTDNTSLSGYETEGGYVFDVKYTNGFAFTIVHDIRSRYMEVETYLAGTQQLLDKNHWDHNFHGKTSITSLSNGDYLFLYIPWSDGVPNYYSYTVGETFEAGGCRP